jgi:hypothetical protein
LTHNGIDIDQFILLAVYPTITFFIIGVIAKRLSLGEPLKYAIQASNSIIFGVVYFLAIPNGGAQGLAVVLVLFGIILFLMARRYVMPLKDEEKGSLKGEEMDETEKASVSSDMTRRDHNVS